MKRELDLAAKFTNPRVEDHAVIFGSLHAEGIEAPGGEPYAAMFAMPHYLWELYGSPQEVAVRLTSHMEPHCHVANAWLEPVYEGG